MNKEVKVFLRKLKIYGLARTLYYKSKSLLQLLVQKVNVADIEGEIVSNYIQSHEVRKLQLGCGNHIIEGWLNSDYLPDNPNILNLDVTKPFPIEDHQIDYIFSEHMIEHINYSEGNYMLSECYRVLRNGGKVRISTPDMRYLIDLYNDEKTEIQKRYLTLIIDYLGLKVTPGQENIFVINQAFYGWGHKFIYNEGVLRDSMEKNGFTNIVRCELNQSKVDVLRNLENETRFPEGLLKLETFTLEGTKLLPVS